MSTLRKISLTVAALAALVILLVSPVLAMSVPSAVYGYVTVNGVATNGISASISGAVSGSYTTKNDANGNPGYYQFGIENGASYTVSASYGGHSASRGFTAGTSPSHVDLPITYSTATATPTATPAPTAAPSSGGEGSHVTVPTIAPPTATPVPTVTPTVNVTASPVVSMNLTATPSPTVIIHTAPEQVATPAPASGQPGWSGIVLPVLAVLLLLLVIAVAGYYFVTRRKE